MADDVEADAVREAIGAGYTWEHVGKALGISRQSAHQRLRHLAPKATREDT